MTYLFMLSKILLLLLVNTVESQSSEEILQKCKYGPHGFLYINTKLTCAYIGSNHLPYRHREDFKRTTELTVYGNFSEMAIDPGYENLHTIRITSPNLETFELGSFANFKKLERIEVGHSDQVVNVDFSGAEKLNLTHLSIHYNKMINYSCESFKSSQLKHITLFHNNLKSFDFSCVPNTMVTLRLSYNNVSTLDLPIKNTNKSNTSTNVNGTTNSYCSYLNNLTSLRFISLRSMGLKEFRIVCLPNSIQKVLLSENYITELPDLSDFVRSHPVELYIENNPFRCTCSLLRDFVRVLDSNSVTFPYSDTAFTCADADSELSRYPWTKSTIALKGHDPSGVSYLTGGEKNGNDKVSNNISGSGNAVDIQSVQEVLSKCTHYYTYKPYYGLSCRNFCLNYLPYFEKFKCVSELVMYGNFSELVIDATYANLKEISVESPNLQKFEFEKYAIFTKLERLVVRLSQQVVNVDFSGAEKLKHLQNVAFHNNKMVNFSCESFKSSNLKHIDLKNNNLENFNFSCVSNSTEEIYLDGNEISTLSSKINQNFPSNNGGSITTQSNCYYLKNLPSLRFLYLTYNRLQDFRFECLPNSIEKIWLDSNEITEITDLSKIPHSHPVIVNIESNPIKCSCSPLRDFVQLLHSGNFSMANERSLYIDCPNKKSKKRFYTWNNFIKNIKRQDAQRLRCLDEINEENDIDKNSNTNNIVNDINKDVNNTNTDSSADKTYYDMKTEYGNKNKVIITAIDNGSEETDFDKISNNNNGKNNTENNSNNDGNNTNTDSIIDKTYYHNDTEYGNKSKVIIIANDNGRDTDDNGNSSSINFIDTFLIIVSHIIQLYFMLF